MRNVCSRWACAPTTAVEMWIGSNPITRSASLRSWPASGRERWREVEVEARGELERLGKHCPTPAGPSSRTSGRGPGGPSVSRRRIGFRDRAAEAVAAADDHDVELVAHRRRTLTARSQALVEVEIGRDHRLLAVPRGELAAGPARGAPRAPRPRARGGARRRGRSGRSAERAARFGRRRARARRGRRLRRAACPRPALRARRAAGPPPGTGGRPRRRRRSARGHRAAGRRRRRAPRRPRPGRPGGVVERRALRRRSRARRRRPRRERGSQARGS